MSVRRKVGSLPNIQINQMIGTGDGSNKDFYIHSGWIVDGNGDERIDENDVTVTIDGSPVTIDKIQPEYKRIRLQNAPASAKDVYATYSISEILDSEIIEEIKRNIKLLEDKTNRSFNKDNEYTEELDGTGLEDTFFLDKKDIYNIKSITVDGDSTLVEGTDYWLYPNSTDIIYIVFNVCPSEDHKNISITYNYGKEDAVAYNWVLTRTAMNIIFNRMQDKQDVGWYQKPQADGTVYQATKSYTSYKELKQQLKDLENDLYGLVDVELFN